MKETSRVKHISEVSVGGKKSRIRKPLRLSQENQRQFVRLEISSPMSLRTIKDTCNNYWPDQTGYPVEAAILNISAGGVLVELKLPLNEGDIVAMRFSLERVGQLEGVLGVVKRSDPDVDCHLAGIEFINRSDLVDKLSRAELDLLPENLAHFNETVQDVLGKYIYQEDVQPSPDLRHETS